MSLGWEREDTEKAKTLKKQERTKEGYPRPIYSDSGPTYPWTSLFVVTDERA